MIRMSFLTALDHGRVLHCRALDELHNACQAANDACREAEASAAASSAALQEQHGHVEQLQCETDLLKHQHEQELLSLQQSMRDQVCWLAACFSSCGFLEGLCCFMCEYRTFVYTTVDRDCNLYLLGPVTPGVVLADRVDTV